MAKDLIALSAAWVREAELPDPLWYQGFCWRFPVFRYKCKPSEEAQPHSVLLFPGKGGVYLCPRSVCALVIAQAVA